MQLSSTDFKNNEFIPSKYSYHGGNLTPSFKVDDLPDNVKSLALICHDPDSPTKNGYVHWVVWNIPPVTEITEQLITEQAVQGLTDWGTKAWGGPAPHQGTHHYNFYLYALDSKLHLPAAADKAQLVQAMVGHILNQTLLTGLYSAK